MKKVEDKQNYCQLFNSYAHNIAVIFSSLEGMYDGELFVDNILEPRIAMLFTPFAFHFVAGEAKTPDAADIIDKLIFQEYLQRSGQKEAIVFAPDSQWESILDQVFPRHQGIKDKRKSFCLNQDKFIMQQPANEADSDYQTRILYEQEKGAAKPYPVCRLIQADECISYCSGFMIGKGHAEIDVFTSEKHRGRGYAKRAAIGLIRELIKTGIEPDWNTWPYRIESEKLALSLGFELKSEIPAHIWVEEECGKL